jgi:Holliday junction resolvase RusA-like endonuclease
VRLKLPLPLSVNRKASIDKEIRRQWQEDLECYVYEKLVPSLRYSFRYCAVGQFETKDGKLKRRDHFNLEKPLVDDVCKAVGIDDKQIVRIEGWKVHREGEEFVLVEIEEMEEREPLWL